MIAIADALSDALGIHISEESSSPNNHKEVWEVTIATFFAKFLFALTFMIPILVFTLSTAIIVSVIYGLVLLTLLSYYIAKEQSTRPFYPIIEHLSIAVVVVIVTHYVGVFVNLYMK